MRSCLLPGLLVWLCWAATAMADSGKDVIGTIQTDLIFATNGDLNRLGMKGKQVPGAEEARLRSSRTLKFKEYRHLGGDRKPVWRAFENWAMPMKPSEELMVSFEPKGEVNDQGLRIDLKLWIQRREVLASLPVLQKGRKLYILGPEWRGGNLIIGIELVESGQ